MRLSFAVTAPLALILLACSALEETSASLVADDVEAIVDKAAEANGDIEVEEAAEDSEHPEAKPYDKSRNAGADVDAALARAKENGKRVVVVMGANWCHDSRGLAGWFERPRFDNMLKAKYEIVYVEVGRPQKDRGRNLKVAQRFGIESQEKTPMVLVLSSDGGLLNTEQDAKSWRNAASREEDKIFDYFDQFTPEL